MTRTEASHLATTIAHDLAQLAPSATRYAVLHKVSDNTYAVLARRGAETVVIAHPDAWTGDEASWQRAKAATVAALAQRKRLRPRTSVRVQLKEAAKAFAMVACCYVALGLFVVGILWLEAIDLLGLVLVPLAIFLMIGIDEAMTAPTQRKRPPRRR